MKIEYSDFKANSISDYNRSDSMALSSDINASLSYLEDKSLTVSQFGHGEDDQGDTLEKQIKILKLQAQELMQRLEEEHSRGICIICFTSKIDSVFLNCGHKVCCNKCAKEFESCPICREKLAQIL